MIEDVFSLGNITLKGSNGGLVTLNPLDIIAMEEVDNGTMVHLSKEGALLSIKVKQSPGRIRQKTNFLAAKQDKNRKKIEEEAKAKAQENFFAKYPKTKAVFEQEAKELAGN